MSTVRAYVTCVKRPIHQANARQEQSTNHDGEDSASVDRFVTNVFNSAFPCPATASNRADLNACIHITPDEFQIQSVQVISNSETCVSYSSFLGVCVDTLRCVFNFVSTLLVGLSPVKFFSVLMRLGAFFYVLPVLMVQSYSQTFVKVSAVCRLATVHVTRL